MTEGETIQVVECPFGCDEMHEVGPMRMGGTSFWVCPQSQGLMHIDDRLLRFHTVRLSPGYPRSPKP